jgi:hypothetical protein
MQVVCLLSHIPVVGMGDLGHFGAAEGHEAEAR